MPPDQADQSTGNPPVKLAEQAQSTGRSDQDSSGARARSISLAATGALQEKKGPAGAGPSLEGAQEVI